MKNAVCIRVRTLKGIRKLGSLTSLLSVHTKLGGFFKPALLRSEPGSTPETPIDDFTVSTTCGDIPFIYFHKSYYTSKLYV
jgi:hypothetical protein